MSHHSSLIDLHCHSIASDGELTPTELVELAHERGVTHLSLTDHDTVSGISEAMARASQLGITIIPGVEFSAQWNGQSVHILGLAIDHCSKVIIDAVDQQARNRFSRARTIAERLQKKGFEGLYEGALTHSLGQAPGRPHFAAAMVERQYVSNTSVAFKKYLGAGKPGDVKSIWPELKEVVGWIEEAGGVAVIAHPRKYNMTMTKLRALIEDFISVGGQGIEVITSGQKQGDIGLLADLCCRYGLKGSLGSDFHTPRQSWVKLGGIPSLPKSVEPVWGSWEGYSI